MQDQHPAIDTVRARVHRLRREVQVACAELGLAQHALERHLPPRVRTGDLAWAVAQGAAVEGKLEQAVQELAALQHILERMAWETQGKGEAGN